MNKNTFDNAVSSFLDEVTDQISYKPLRPSIRQELESHLQDRMEEYQSQGFSSEDAVRQAISRMGDPVLIGTELNEVHRIQKAPWLSFITALLLLTGFGLSAFMQWTPEQAANGFLYYIPGGILLIITVFKGYPLLIRYRKIVAVSICLLYLALAVITTSHVIIFWYPPLTYFATLLLIPVITILLYCSRKSKKKFMAAAVGSAGSWLLFMYSSRIFLIDTAIIIFLLSASGSLFFMIHRRILPGKKKYLYSGALSLLVLLGSPLFLTASGRENIKAFLVPQSTVYSTWSDTYNGILVQELLSKTPLTHGLELSGSEMMDYGTGAWYFASRDPKQIGIDVTQQDFQEKVDALRDQGYHPRYIHYQGDQVTLWDILPQHYHNNYLIAVCIFLFGWLPGLALLGVIGLFFMFLFSCITRIHGHLASALAFSCGQCLLWQGIFYLLGNFGYQYAYFPNMPLVSEGRLSSLCNMLLLGLIFSAYRYDCVTEEPLNYGPVTSD